MMFEEFKSWKEVDFPFKENPVPNEPHLYAWFFDDTPFYVGESGCRKNGSRVNDQSLQGKRGKDRRSLFKHCPNDFDVAWTRDRLAEAGHKITLRFIRSSEDRKKGESILIWSLLSKRVLLLNYLTGCCRAETEADEIALLKSFVRILGSSKYGDFIK
jgi:hypothetical protein